MNPFFQALEEGHSPEAIISYLSRAIPQIAEPIKKATKAGYSLQNIIGFLSKKFDTEDRRGMSESERRGANIRADAERTKFGLKMAATAVAAPLAAAAAKGALSRALPSSLTNMLNPTGAPPSPQPSGAPATPQPNAPINPGGANPLQAALAPTLQTPQAPNQLPNASQQPPNIPQASSPTQPNIAQQPQITQPQGIPSQSPINSSEILSKHNIKEKVDSILKAKNNPEAVSAFYEKFSPKVKKEIEKETGVPFEQVIDQYSKENQDTNLLPESSKSVEETKPIEKGVSVATPHGVGEVLSNRNGKALIEIDGKKHQVNEDEIETSPVPEKDLAELHDELLRGIEKETEEDVSRMVQWAGYNPETNTLQFLPHTGKLYKYGNISPEDAALLTDILSVRKTSGSNFIGAWKKGSKSPIGAALSKLIRKLQSERGGKGNEYEETHEPIYSAYEPAIEFKKNKKKKKK